MPAWSFEYDRLSPADALITRPLNSREPRLSLKLFHQRHTKRYSNISNKSIPVNDSGTAVGIRKPLVARFPRAASGSDEAIVLVC